MKKNKKKHKTKTLSAFFVFLAFSLHPTLESKGRKGRRKEKIPPAPAIATGLPEGWHLSAHKVFFFCLIYIYITKNKKTNFEKKKKPIAVMRRPGGVLPNCLCCSMLFSLVFVFIEFFVLGLFYVASHGSLRYPMMSSLAFAFAYSMAISGDYCLLAHV